MNSKPPGIQLVEMNEDEVVLGPQDGGADNSVEITLYVLIGNPSSNTIRVKGRIKKWCLSLILGALITSWMFYVAFCTGTT